MRHISPIPPAALQRHLASLPTSEQVIIKEAVTTLQNSINHVGKATAIEILWAIGREMQRQDG